MSSFFKNIKAIKLKIRSIPNWPQKGIIFRDITPILQDAKLLFD